MLDFEGFFEKYKKIKNKKIGILTNHSFCNRNLVNFLDFLLEKNFNIKVIFSPEHGFFGTFQMEEKVNDDYYKNIPVKSLYGDKIDIDIKDLDDIEILIIAIPDNGSRYYTYKWTALKLIEKFDKKIIIFDYPNPLNGISIEGPLIEKNYKSFVGLYPIPVRFGLTIGELSLYIKGEFKMDKDIEIFRIKNWKRKLFFDDTSFPFITMSPNMIDFETSLLYPGMCLLEGTNISEGRGTAKPFKIFGADFIDPFNLFKKLEKIEGVRFKPVYFRPMWNKYKEKICGGCEIYIENKRKLKSFKMGLLIIKSIMELYPEKFEFKNPPYEFEKEKKPFDILVGNSYVREMLQKGDEIEKIEKKWKKDLKEFDEKRRKYFLYD
ncbi:MAG: DUF1343 domain-containing protein [candidate division WOR-3 bacterium]